MKPLLAGLRANATVVTATRRLQHHLLDLHGIEQRDSGAQAWPTPAVHFWDDWLTGLWQAASYGGREPQPLLLDEHQELWLWERSIRAAIHDQPHGELLPVPATARAARDAWRAASEWELRPRDIKGAPGSDAAVFAAWAASFGRRCRDRGWLTRAELPTRLGRLLAQGEWRPALRHLVLAGFDELPPTHARLIGELASAGVTVERSPPPCGGGSIEAVAYLDSRSEIVAAAHWARRRLERGDRGPVGVVVPDLSRRRDEVERVFDRILHPDHPWGTWPETGRAFHISLGRPLSEFPLVVAALDALQLARRPLHLEHLAAFLDSPFVRGWDKEAEKRSLLERRLRERAPERLQWGEVRWLLAWEEGACPLLFDLLQGLADLGEEAGVRRSPPEWAGFFDRWLQAAGWPGDRGLDSAEQQTREAWHELLTGFAGLGLVTAELGLERALTRVQHMARGRIFQPQSSPAPVQVLGLTETAGMEFESLWLAGMDDARWPPPPRPDPFLPLALQLERGMPHADPAAELACSERQTRRLLDSAAEVRVSFARLLDDQPARLSPLLAALTPAASEEAEFDEVDYAALLQRHRPVLTAFADPCGPPLETPLEVRGGAGLFRDQSACPFRAFTHYRLQARAYPLAEPGVSALDRGNIVHLCLQSLWSSLGSQQRLLDLGDAERVKLVREHMDRVLDDPRWAVADRFRARVLQIERRRLAEVVKQWLEQETKRPPFRVLATETAIDVTLAGMKVELRADRIDEYGDGAQLIIDYKTAAQNQAYRAWLGERPEEPQLPLYLLASDSAVQALALGVVRRGGCGLTGYAREQSPAPGVEPVAGVGQLEGLDWEQLVAHWRRVLTRLATEFVAGAAGVEPRDAEACRYCDAHALCRIHESVPAEEHGDD